MKKLWEKTKTKGNSIVDDYCFKEGIGLDNNLVEYDVYGSVTHAKMLSKIGIIDELEFQKLKKNLVEILELKKQGKFMVEEHDEDVHTKVENYLTKKLGDLGKKIHTGRSRNDQVLVDLRLYAKENLLTVTVSIYRLIDTFIKHAKKYEFILMPGYTHMQKAMPSSVGMWLGSFAEQFLDIMLLITSAYELNDQSPLGSGAAYGVSLPIDRELTAKLLGFSKVQNNSLYCQISRPTVQLAIMQVLVQIMLAASRFAQDLLLFTTSEFNFFSVDESLCTGSSIMPQKKNLDLMEYVRAKTQVVIGYEQMVASISAGVPSGYNADFGQTKGPFMKAFDITLKTLDVLKLTLTSIQPNIDVLKKACTPELYATHLVYQYVKKGIPFRKAYQKVGKLLNDLPQFDPIQVLKESNHIGGTGNLNLKSLTKKISTIEKEWKQKQKQYYKLVIKKLIE